MSSKIRNCLQKSLRNISIAKKEEWRIINIISVRICDIFQEIVRAACKRTFKLKNNNYNLGYSGLTLVNFIIQL